MKNFSKLIIAVLAAVLSTVAFAQKERIGRIDYFDKAILDHKITKVYLNRSGSRYLEVEGVKTDQVNVSVENEVMTVTINGNASDISLFINNNSLKRIEAGPGVEIFGANVLSGGAGKFYVQSFVSNAGEDCACDFDFDIDFDFDFDEDDFDFDFDFDFDYDYDGEAYNEEWNEKWEKFGERFNDMWERKWNKSWNNYSSSIDAEQAEIIVERLEELVYIAMKDIKMDEVIIESIKISEIEEIVEEALNRVDVDKVFVETKKIIKEIKRDNQ